MKKILTYLFTIICVITGIGLITSANSAATFTIASDANGVIIKDAENSI